MQRIVMCVTGLAALSLCAVQNGQSPVAPGESGPPATGGPARVAEAPTLAPGEAVVDVVFALDATGSMSGLIEGAKQKIWSIANEIASAQPRPELRLGLVAYRDRGDAFVTRLTPLTEDLDQIYADLMALAAAGGGDGPESVNQALHEAVTRMAWSDDARALRIVYLVGDAPPHMDYAGEVQYRESAGLAASRGIIVNTLQCGSDTAATAVWREIAGRAEGRYFAIDASAPPAAVATPFDAEIARLGQEMSATVVSYGSADELEAQRARAEKAAALGAAAAPAVAADRAVYNASESGARNLAGSQELVQDVRDGRVDLKAIAPEGLPEPMRSLTPEQRQDFVEAKAAERAVLQARVQELAKERDAFVKNELAKRDAAAAGPSFDDKLLGALREQAAVKGIRYVKE